MHMPQELRDLIALRAGTIKVSVALLASEAVQDAVDQCRRMRIIDRLQSFMASETARRNGMLYLRNLNSTNLYFEFAECEGRVGGWSVLNEHSKQFIEGGAHGIEISWGYSYDHFGLHRTFMDVRYGFYWDEFGDLALDEATACVEMHIACILALAGYVTDGRLHVTGCRRVPAVEPTKNVLQICPAMDA
jgi:hypothetical protein